MKFTPRAMADLRQLSDATPIKDKFRRLGDSGLTDKGQECHYRPGVYYSKITGSISCLYVMMGHEPKVVRIADKTVIYRIMTRRRRLWFWERL